nr:MAG TPA: hypothetical protein [Caudoviricetes sp.]
MQQIILGNDTTLSLILYAQALLLPDPSGSSHFERRQIDLSLAREISVQLIPYMRWHPVRPEWRIRQSILEVDFPATLQLPGKWDIEVSYFAPSISGCDTYIGHRLRQGLCEVLPRHERGYTTPEAYIITADITTAMQGATGLSAFEFAKSQGWVATEQEYATFIKGDPGNDGIDAYASYLATTKDDPKMPEEEWATGGWLVILEMLKKLRGAKQ